jgi:hypothetical protein
MHIYNFPIYKSIYGIPENMSIDLDYIVAITPVDTVQYFGNTIGSSYAYFTICTKMGQPYNICYYSNNCIHPCPQEIVDKLTVERLKLIEVWQKPSEPHALYVGHQ